MILGADLIIATSSVGKPDKNITGSALRLPKESILGAHLSGLDLIISTDQKFIGFFRRLGKNDTPGIFRGVGKYVILDTRKGKMQNIEQLLKDESYFGLSGSSGEPEFSPSGHDVLIHAIPDLGTGASCGTSTTLFVVNLETKGVMKLEDDYFGGGKWIGDSIAIATGDDQEIDTIKIIDIKEKKSRRHSCLWLCDHGRSGRKISSGSSGSAKVRGANPLGAAG